MNEPLEVPDHSHARFGVLGGAVGALIAIISGVVCQLWLAQSSINSFILMYLWPWFLGFAYTAGEGGFSVRFFEALLFTAFLNFALYWLIFGLIWCGLHWNWIFFVIVGAPVVYYWCFVTRVVFHI